MVPSFLVYNQTMPPYAVAEDLNKHLRCEYICIEYKFEA